MDDRTYVRLGRIADALERAADAAELQALVTARESGWFTVSDREVKRMTLLKSRIADGERDPA